MKSGTMSQQLIVLILLFACCTFAQQNKIYGDPYPTSISGGHKTYFQEDSFVYAVKANNYTIAVQKFNLSKLNLIKEVQFKIKLSRDGKILKVLKFEGKCYVFYTDWNKKRKMDDLYACEVNYKNLLIAPARLLVVVKGEAYEHYNEPKFNLVLSEDGSKLLVHYKVKPAYLDDRALQSKRGFHVFEKDLGFLSKKSGLIPYLNGNIEVKDFAVSNNGIPSMLLGNLEQKCLELLLFNDKYDFFERIILDELEDWKTPSQMHQDAQGNWQIISFSPLLDKLFVYDASNMEPKVYKIPNTVKEHYINQKDRVYPIEVLEVHNQEDGSIIIVANKRPPNRIRGKFIEGFRHYDFLIAKIEQDKSLAWMSLLPRRFEHETYSPRPIYHYTYSEEDDKHYVIYGDSKANERLNLNQLPNLFMPISQRVDCTYVIDNKNGAVTRYPLLQPFKKMEDPYWYLPACDFIYIGDDFFVRDYYIGGGEDLLIKIHISE